MKVGLLKTVSLITGAGKGYRLNSALKEAMSILVLSESESSVFKIKISSTAFPAAIVPAFIEIFKPACSQAELSKYKGSNVTPEAGTVPVTTTSSAATGPVFIIIRRILAYPPAMTEESIGDITTTSDAPTGVGVMVIVGVLVSEGVAVGVLVSVAVFVFVDVTVIVGVFVSVPSTVGVIVGVCEGVEVRVALGVAVNVGVGVDVRVGVKVGLSRGPTTTVAGFEITGGAGSFESMPAIFVITVPFAQASALTVIVSLPYSYPKFPRFHVTSPPDCEQPEPPEHDIYVVHAGTVSQTLTEVAGAGENILRLSYLS